ncbi:MAG: hypothetical protein ABJE66_36945 [Deltaproteobacteria bacterium]
MMKRYVIVAALALWARWAAADPVDANDKHFLAYGMALPYQLDGHGLTADPHWIASLELGGRFGVSRVWWTAQIGASTWGLALSRPGVEGKWCADRIAICAIAGGGLGFQSERAGTKGMPQLPEYGSRSFSLLPWPDVRAGIETAAGRWRLRTLASVSTGDGVTYGQMSAQVAIAW